MDMLVGDGGALVEATCSGGKRGVSSTASGSESLGGVGYGAHRKRAHTQETKGGARPRAREVGGGR